MALPRARPILAVGPLPPPWHGVATAMGYLRDAAPRMTRPLRLLDTADRRGLSNVGRLDAGNVGRALQDGARFLRALLARPAAVYVCVSQGALGYLRDALFLVPARLLRVPLVVHVHGGYFRRFLAGSPAPLRALIRFTLARAARVVVLGERYRSDLDGVVPRERVVVVPNGIDPAPYAAARARRPAGRAPRLVFLGTISEDKGALDVLRAAPAILSRFPDAEIVLAGESMASDEAALERLRAELPGDRVRLAGVVTGDDKIRLLAEADVFLFPTRYPYEGHPYVILEAMAAGLPVVTTDQGCIAETVEHGVNGLMVPHGDPAAIADAAVRLLDAPALRQRMGAANVDRIAERYTLEGWQRAMVAILEEAADAREVGASAPLRPESVS